MYNLGIKPEGISTYQMKRLSSKGRDVSLFLLSFLVLASSLGAQSGSSETQRQPAPPPAQAPPSSGGGDKATTPGPPQGSNPAEDPRIKTGPGGAKSPSGDAAGGPGGGGGAPVDSKSYQIGPEDILYVRVWREADFSGSYTVHSDGKITFPLIGDLAAANKTPVEVEKEIGEALKKYIVNPLVTVTVQAVVSRRYYMDGEIARAGEYPLPAPVTVLEAISRAGGLRDFANSKKIVILRKGKRIRFNYKEVTHGKKLDQNIQVEPGDHIIIP